MKYYVYAGYYENFISGHKLPKPYTLRDEFKTFDEALDYVWENWEDDAIFFTEDVIGDAIDNGFIDDENWEDYLMKESKKSATKSIKEAKNGYYIYSKPLDKKYAYCDKSKFTEEGFYLIEDYMLDAIHIFDTEKEAQEFIDKHAKRFMVDKDNIIIAEYPSTKYEFFESKKSARKSIKESERFPKLDEFKKFYATDDRIAHCEWEDVGRYTIFCEDDVDIEKLAKEMLKEFNGSHYNLYNKSSMPHLDRKYPNHFEFYLKWYESKKTIRKSIKESHGFDEENEYMFELSVVTNESLIEDTLKENGLEVDWDYISKVSAELDYAIERKFAKEIGHVAVEEFHDDNSYNCTFWVRFDDAKVNKYMKNLSYFDDYTRGISTVFVYDVDDILDNEIDKLEKKYDSDILGILRECMAVEIAVPTDSI